MKSGKTIGTIFGIAIVFSFVLAGCETGTGTSPTVNTDPKTINITGFPGSTYSGSVAMLTLLHSLTSQEVTAVGGDQITGNSLSLPLYINEYFTARWKGSGEYIVFLTIGKLIGIDDVVIEKMFIYSDEEPNDLGNNIPKYPVTEPVSAIPFGMFYDITEWAIENGLL
jgi:hypothetical protein